MKINPITPVVYKGKINKGWITLSVLAVGSILGARAINKRTDALIAVSA